MASQYLLILLFLLGMLVFLLAAMVLLLGYLIFTGRRLPGLRQDFFRGDDFRREMVRRQVREDDEKGDGSFCHRHPKREAAGDCALCERHFCRKCLRQQDGVSFCLEHIKVYLNNSWVDLGEECLNPERPEEGQHLYRLKYDLWNTHKRPALISTSYRINIEGDTIESFVKIRVPRQDREATLQMIDSYKQKKSNSNNVSKVQ